MLCPIHASCQLPNENPQKQSRQKRKPAVERHVVFSAIDTRHFIQLHGLVSFSVCVYM